MGRAREEWVCPTDPFGLATSAAGSPELRGDIGVLGMLEGRCPPREALVGMCSEPGTPLSKVMVRTAEQNYIHVANSGRGHLFDVDDHSEERCNQAHSLPEAVGTHKAVAAATRAGQAARGGLGDGGLLPFQCRERPRTRICQSDHLGGEPFPARLVDAPAS